MSGKDLNPTLLVHCPETRRREYSRLKDFRDRVRAHHNAHYCAEAIKIEHFTTDYGGVGLKATDTILKGQTVVWYGGPYVPIKTSSGWHASPTHSLSVADPNEDIFSRSSCAEISKVLDGEVVSAFYRDTEVVREDQERKDMLMISGSLMDSNMNPSTGCTKRENNAIKATADGADLFFETIDGVKYGAQRIVAKHDIKKGEELLMFYYLTPVHMKQRNPLAFNLPQEANKKKETPPAAKKPRRMSAELLVKMPTVTKMNVAATIPDLSMLSIHSEKMSAVVCNGGGCM